MIKRRIMKNSGGMTLLEILVGLAIFAIGCFTLTQVIFGAMKSGASARKTVVATTLAHERMSQIMKAGRFGDIREENFPDEDYGRVGGGAGDYGSYRRTVTITDSMDSSGSSLMKTVEIEVEWRESGRRRNVSLRSCVTRADMID